MIPITQTDPTKETGNCFAACIASILEIPLDEMPNFHSEFWADDWIEWLRPRGFSLMTWDLPDDIEILRHERRRYLMPGYCILAAESPRFDCLHAVVCLDGEIVHDPHPERSMGVKAWKQVDFLMCLDAKRALLQPQK